MNDKITLFLCSLSFTLSLAASSQANQIGIKLYEKQANIAISKVLNITPEQGDKLYQLFYNEQAYYAKLNIVPFTATTAFKEYQQLSEADRDIKNTTNQQAKNTIKTLTKLMANNEKIIAKDIGVTKDELKKLKHQYAYADELIKNYEYTKQTSPGE